MVETELPTTCPECGADLLAAPNGEDWRGKPRFGPLACSRHPFEHFPDPDSHAPSGLITQRRISRPGERGGVGAKWLRYFKKLEAACTHRETVREDGTTLYEVQYPLPSPEAGFKAMRFTMARWSA